MGSRSTLILSKAKSRLLVLALSAMAAILMVLAFFGAPPAFALSNTADQTWNAAGTVFASALSEDGDTLYIGGKFDRVRENPPGVPGASFAVSNVAAIDVATGEAIPTWNPQVTGEGAVVRSLFEKNGKVYIGGNFTAVGGEPRQNLAAVDAADGDAADGSVDPFAPQVTKGTGSGAYVYA
ncbi:MAG: hypothetical protein ACRDTR_05560, partial [Rubrobacter sp.]